MGILKIVLSFLIILIILLRLEIIGQPIMNMSFRLSDDKILKEFKNENLKPEIKYHTFKGQTMRYLELALNPNLPYVVFIHGAPGSLSDYSAFFRDEELYRQINLISVDRLGYGNSEFGTPETSLKVQGEAIQSIIEKACNSRPVLVGHSYGGPIAIKMVMDNPMKYKSIILLAPALDPANEKEIILAKLPLIQPIRWLTPPALRVASDEKMTHINELKKMLGKYHEIEVPVLHIHGTDDSLVPYENLSFSIKNMTPSILETISLDNTDHFLPWSHHDLIRNQILTQLE